MSIEETKHGVDPGWSHGYMELIAVLEVARAEALPGQMAKGKSQPTDRSGDE